MCKRHESFTNLTQQLRKHQDKTKNTLQLSFQEIISIPSLKVQNFFFTGPKFSSLAIAGSSNTFFLHTLSYCSPEERGNQFVSDLLTTHLTLSIISINLRHINSILQSALHLLGVCNGWSDPNENFAACTDNLLN